MQMQNIMSGRETKRRSITRWWGEHCRSAVWQNVMGLGNLRFSCFHLSGTLATHSACLRENRKYVEACRRATNKPLPALALLKQETEPCKRCITGSWTKCKGSEVAVSRDGDTCKRARPHARGHRHKQAFITPVQHSLTSINSARLLMWK